MACARPAIVNDRPTALSKALGFLVRDYEPAYFWWELLEAWKKLSLVGFAVILDPGSIPQLVAAFIFSLIFMLLCAIAAPFKDDSDDYFSKACGFALSAVFFFSVILKISVLTDAVEDQLSPHLRKRFSFDVALVSVGMIASIVGALLLAAAMAVDQLIALARKPLIKLVATKSTPDMPLAKGHKWHMFLSHIWGTGQDQCASIKRQLTLLMPDASIFLDVDDLESIDALEEYVDASAVIMIFVSAGDPQSSTRACLPLAARPTRRLPSHTVWRPATLQHCHCNTKNIPRLVRLLRLEELLARGSLHGREGEAYRARARFGGLPLDLHASRDDQGRRVP